MTIFGVPWAELGIERVQAFLDKADDEPLLWEAKGTQADTGEIRRQVCAFANSHEGGYLILGADRVSGAQGWRLDGVEFPAEPMTWIATVVEDPERGVRPRPDFDVKAWRAANGHVAVVRVRPISTPPCIANGTVYERSPGRTATVRDPLRLADLFARGDQARRDAQARADRAAWTLMHDALEGSAGVFETGWNSARVERNEEPPVKEDTAHVRFAVGLAGTGNASDVSGRLFRNEFAEEIWTALQTRPTHLPLAFRRPPDPVSWSQDALTWRHQMLGHVRAVTVIRAVWDGSASAGETMAVDDVHIESLVEGRIAPEWRLADQVVKRLGGFGDFYVTVVITGGGLTPQTQPDTRYLVMRRGPLHPGVDNEQVASLKRKLLRAAGRAEPEP